MPGVFISYRREDTQGYAGSLARSLDETVGPELVFLDTADIVGGTDFPTVLHDAVVSSHVLLALIGPRWLTVTGRDGKPRLHDPSDFVRQEIALALQEGIRVIPVLVEGAQMPTREDLPEDLHALATSNALELSNSHWDEDIARLTEHIHEAIYAGGVRNAALSRISPRFTAIPPMTRDVRRFVAFALAFGVLFTLIALVLLAAQRTFMAKAIPATAEVTGFYESRSDEGGVSYYPEFRFVTGDGRTWQARAAIGANPPAYRIGEQIPIRYDPAEPMSASIDTPGARYLLTWIFFGIGILWLLIGVAPVLARWFRKRRYRFLLEHGSPILTTFAGVEVEWRITVQGRQPYVIVTEWRNPVSQELVEFRSHPVWQDPTDKAKHRAITVLVDPNNFRHYVMDLSFLAEQPAGPIERL